MLNADLHVLNHKEGNTLSGHNHVSSMLAFMTAPMNVLVQEIIYIDRMLISAKFDLLVYFQSCLCIIRFIEFNTFLIGTGEREENRTKKEKVLRLTCDSCSRLRHFLPGNPQTKSCLGFREHSSSPGMEHAPNKGKNGY